MIFLGRRTDGSYELSEGTCLKNTGWDYRRGFAIGRGYLIALCPTEFHRLVGFKLRKRQVVAVKKILFKTAKIMR